MSSGLAFFSKEIQTEAADFLKSLWSEDSDGSQLPKFSPEEVKDMAVQRFGHEKSLPRVVSEDFRKQWNKLSNTVRNQVDAEAASRKLERPLEELLQKAKLGISAAYTVRGRLSLLKWAATGELEHLQQATDLFKSAAENGDPEACYLLARYCPTQESRWDDESEITLHSTGPEFLVMEDTERENYFDRSLKARYMGALDEIEERERQQIELDTAREEDDADHYEEWLKKLNFEYNSRESKITHHRGLSNRTDTQELMLGKLLWEKMLDDVHQHGAEWSEALTQEARICLGKAAATLPEARYWLALYYSDLSDEMKNDLYLHAAYPQVGALPYQRAFLPLARSYIERGSLDLAEKTLRDQSQYFDKQNDIKCARYELAEFIREHRHSDADKEAEALEIYRELSDISSWCAYCAAILLVKKGNDQANYKESEALLNQARCGMRWPSFDEPPITTVYAYAEIAYKLGWGESWTSLESVVDKLLELLERSGFRGVDECLITPEIASLLMSLNRNQKGIQNLFDETINSLKGFTGMESLSSDKLDEFFAGHHLIGIYGKRPKYLVEGLLYALRSGLLAQEELTNLLGNHTLVSEYVKARLISANRFNGEMGVNAIGGFKQAIAIGEQLIKWEGLLSKFGKSIRQRIIDNSRLEERRLIEEKQRADVALAEEKAKKEMLSFLSHTLTNATTGASNTLRKIASELASAEGNIDVSYCAQRLGSQAANVAMVENLVEVFKLYTSDPKALHEGWERDHGGGVSVYQVCALAIRQALLRFYFSSDYEVAFQRLMPEADYESASREFMADVLVLDMNTPAEVDRFVDWIKQRLPFLQVSLQGVDSLQLKEGGPRAIVIFALTGEFLGNALKYAAGEMPITLELQARANGLELTCRNAVDPAAPALSRGGRMGLTFVHQICLLIGAEFDEPAIKDNVFSLRALLPIQ